MLATETAKLLASRTALVVGASSGAVEALSQLLPVLPEASRIPVVVVVHLPPSRPSLLPEVFSQRRCAVSAHASGGQGAGKRRNGLVRAFELSFAD